MHDTQTIEISDVSTTLHLGVGAPERARSQAVLVSVRLSMVDPPSFETDATLSDTVDYDHVIHFIRDTLPAQGEIVLIETVADRVAAHCLALCGRIIAAEVTVKKPSVLVAPGMVAVTVMRTADPARRRQQLHVAGEPG